MSDERRKRLFGILEAALERTQTAQKDILRELCGGDPALLKEAEAMLDLEAEAQDLFTVPAADLRSFLPSPEAVFPKLELKSRLGPYRIVELLGEGGMGSVYRAVREDDFEKQVAIKLLRGDLGAPSALERFHVERQILARFEHPSIARLLDGGATSEGQPFLVMEYVHGVPIDEYCESHRLSVRQRLELFRQVLPAVAYAHRNLVVHRDLKPGNILVTPEGVPRLLDFGIAKLLDARGPTASVDLAARSPLTPRFASPEQVRGEPITTASDVFSLGVLLYQLLTRRHPWWCDEVSPRELSQRICEEAAPPPSSRITGDNRRSRRVRRALAGDVDAIVLKALHQDLRQRYAAIEEFDEDLRRHFEALPIGARRGDWAYRTGRLLRRRKRLVALAVLIVGFSLAATVLWRRAEGERQRADLERAVAVAARQREERVSELLKDLFRAAHPDSAQGRRVTSEEILAAGRERFTSGLEDDPELAAELVGTLGDVYRELGFYDEAIELLERSVLLRRELRPKDDPGLAVALSDLASAHYYAGSYREAARRFRQVLVLRRGLGQEPELIALASSNLASALKQLGEFAEAGELYRQALALREGLYGPEDPRIASSLYALGSLLYERGDLEGAVEPLRRVLRIRTAELGERHTRVATVLGTLGRLLHARGELAEAEELLRRALVLRRELLGEAHAHVALSRRDLGAVLLDQGRAEEAGGLIEEALASLRRSQSPDDWAIPVAESLWGSYLTSLGRFDEAEPLLDRSFSALRAAKGEPSIYTRQAGERLAAFRKAREAAR